MELELDAHPRGDPQRARRSLMGGEGKENKGTTGTEVRSRGPEEEQVWAGQHGRSS